MAGLPEPSQIAVGVFLLTAAIVILDGWKLLRAHREIPNLGPFANGGMAWKSRFEQELVRNMTMLGAIAVMIVAPWFLAERSGTDVRFVILFDILLAIHAIWLLLPKRYAVTRDALWVDGFRVDWARLWWTGYKGRSAIILQRRGWWRLAPLPLGGGADDLAAAALRIDAALTSDWDVLVDLLAQEEE